jgi:protein-S-isoprenylcysteine O-methyltransferase Ste14
VRRVLVLVAWTGGAVFVASLANFAVFYLWTLGQPGPALPAPSRWRALGHNLALFALFAVHHSLVARPTVKRWLVGYVPPWLERSLYVWTASLLFFATCLAWRRLGGLVYAVPPEARWLGYLVQVAGVGLVARASAALDVLELAGIRQVVQALGGDAAPTTPQRGQPALLQTTGAYRLVRHPVYLGWVLLVFGAPVMTGDRLLFATLSTLYLVVAIPLEERALLAQYGEAYRRYAQTVRWRLVPGLY